MTFAASSVVRCCVRWALLLAVLAPASASASAGRLDASSELRVAAGVWSSDPCATRPITVRWDPRLAADGAAGRATGVQIDAAGVWSLRACEISLEPAEWLRTSGYFRCLTVLHEVGHLGLRPHTALAGDPVGYGLSPQSACASPDAPLRDRVEDALLRRHAGAEIRCGAWQGRVLACEVAASQGDYCYRARGSHGAGLRVRRVTLTEAGSCWTPRRQAGRRS